MENDNDVKIFDVAVFVLSSLVTGASFTSVSLLVITGSGTMAVFICKGLPRNPEMGNATAWVLFNIWRLWGVRVTRLMLQIARFTVFTVSGLLRENQERGMGGKKCHSLPFRLVLKCQEIRNRVENGSTNSQHK